MPTLFYFEHRNKITSKKQQQTKIIITTLMLIVSSVFFLLDNMLVLSGRSSSGAPRVLGLSVLEDKAMTPDPVLLLKADPNIPSFCHDSFHLDEIPQTH